MTEPIIAAIIASAIGWLIGYHAGRHRQLASISTLIRALEAQIALLVVLHERRPTSAPPAPENTRPSDC